MDRLIFLFSILFLSGQIVVATEFTTKLALNWKAEPEFGGFFEGNEKGIYKKNGFNLEILEGGSGTPTVQMLMSGQIEYAILSSEEIILNNDRDPKRKLVAVFAVFESSPYMIMSHAKQNYQNLKQVFQTNGSTISLQKGLPYVDYLLHKFGPVKAEIVPYSGGITSFEKNSKLAQQGFLTSEFLLAQGKDLDPKAWLVSDEGFNPYIAVLAVREEFLIKNRNQVAKMVEATREGWNSYLSAPDQTNQAMHKLNPSMSNDMMGKSLKQMTKLMKFEPQKLGQMKKQRWQTLSQQMMDLKLISKPIESDKIFQDF